jgi:hypothetical protein
LAPAQIYQLMVLLVPPPLRPSGRRQSLLKVELEGTAVFAELHADPKLILRSRLPSQHLFINSLAEFLGSSRAARRPCAQNARTSVTFRRAQGPT